MNPTDPKGMMVGANVSIDYTRPNVNLSGCQIGHEMDSTVSREYNCDKGGNVLNINLDADYEFAARTDTGSWHAQDGGYYKGKRVAWVEPSVGKTSATLHVILDTGANSIPTGDELYVILWVKRKAETCTIHDSWGPPPNGWPDTRSGGAIVIAGTEYDWKAKGWSSADEVPGCKLKPDAMCTIPGKTHYKANDPKCCADPCVVESENQSCGVDPPKPGTVGMAVGSTQTATSENGICAVNLGGAVAHPLSAIPDKACDPVNSNKANTNNIPTQLGRPSDNLQFQFTVLKKAQILRDKNPNIDLAKFDIRKCYTSNGFNGNMADNDKYCQLRQSVIPNPNSTMEGARELDTNDIIQNPIQDLCTAPTTINSIKLVPRLASF
jgi:hypothetical protein